MAATYCETLPKVLTYHEHRSSGGHS